MGKPVYDEENPDQEGPAGILDGLWDLLGGDEDEPAPAKPMPGPELNEKEQAILNKRMGVIDTTGVAVEEPKKDPPRPKHLQKAKVTQGVEVVSVATQLVAAGEASDAAEFDRLYEVLKTLVGKDK